VGNEEANGKRFSSSGSLGGHAGKRLGYELSFTPVSLREKRAVKAFIDVACDRMGDALGAGILWLRLTLGPQQPVELSWFP